MFPTVNSTFTHEARLYVQFCEREVRRGYIRIYCTCLQCGSITESKLASTDNNLQLCRILAVCAGSNAGDEEYTETELM